MYFQAHTACYKQLPVECSFGCLRQIMVPPYAVSVPRMDIAQEDLVRMPRKQGTCVQENSRICQGPFSQYDNDCEFYWPKQ